MTIFLVSVFGLIKLTSEDPNALKNLASGHSLVDDLLDASSLLRSRPESMQKLLSIESEAVDWAAENGCCYGRAVHGDGLDAGPAWISTLKQCGFFFVEDICKRPYFWKTSVVVDNAQLDVAHIDPPISKIDAIGPVDLEVGDPPSGDGEFSIAPLFKMLA